MDGPAHRTGDVIPFPTERLQDALIVDVDGFEGPLDLLLALARSQKVDLTRISILALAEQYLAFIDAARLVRLEIAADYLVMAAWLAYLKSRLLLPEPEVPDEAPSGEELAAALAERLRKLEAIRAAARRLGDRAQLNRDVFARGMPEGIRTVRRSRFEASLHDLVAAYVRRRQAAAAPNASGAARHRAPEGRRSAEGGAGDPGAAPRRDARLVSAAPPARSLSDGRDGPRHARQLLRGEPGTRPGGPGRASPGGALRADSGAIPIRGGMT